MVILCVNCELWLVKPRLCRGEVSYYCLRCDTFPEGGKLVDLEVSLGANEDGPKTQEESC
jgi:hypothetical protein